MRRTRLNMVLYKGRPTETLAGMLPSESFIGDNPYVCVCPCPTCLLCSTDSKSVATNLLIVSRAELAHLVLVLD